MEKFVLKEDLIIKAGTVFESYNGQSVEYVSGNYGTIVSSCKDGVVNIVIDESTLEHLKLLKLQE